MFNQSNDPDAARFNRVPSKRVLLIDLEEGDWNDDEKALLTRYGKVKRIRFIGTVIEKREVLDDAQKESFISDNNMSRSRVTLLLDDGTGRIWATRWGALPEDYAYIKKGDLVDIGGIVRYYRNHPSINFDMIRKLDNPNFEAYHILEILKKRKTEPRFEFEKKAKQDAFEDVPFAKKAGQRATANDSSVLDELEESESENASKIKSKSNIISKDSNVSKDIEPEDEVDAVPKNKKSKIAQPRQSKPISTEDQDQDILKKLDLTQQIIDYIESHDNGDGASLKEMAEELKMDENAIKKHVDQLCQDVKIYKVRPGFYSAYNK